MNRNYTYEILYGKERRKNLKNWLLFIGMVGLIILQAKLEVIL